MLQYHQCSVANSEAGDNSLRKKLLAFWTPYILSHTPGALPIGEKKICRFFPKNLWVKNEKSIKNVVTNFLEFIGFMVFKTTVSISRLTSFLRFGKRCFLARDISKSLSFFMFFHFTFLWISLAKKHRFPNRKKLVNREIETVVLHTINPMNSKK